MNPRQSHATAASAPSLRAQDRDRYLTALFAPAARRDSLLALYAFNYELARIREIVREPMMGAIRLQWWRDWLGGVYEGVEPGAHELAAPLAAAIRDHDLSRAHFDRLIDAREADFAPAPPADLEALEAYAEASGAPLVALALEILGVGGEAAQVAACAAGAAHALSGLLRAVPFHARARRLYLPAELIAGVDVERAVFARDPRPDAALVAAVRAVAARAAARLAAARDLRAGLPRRAVPALLVATVAGRNLARLARAGHDPFAPALRRPDGTLALRLAAAAFSGRY